VVTVPTGTLISAERKSRINLDSNGNVTGIPVFWQNSDLNPSGTYYVATGYSVIGQRVFGPISLTI
jgi:hypothetical protein